MNDEYEDVGYIWFSYHRDRVWEGHVAISPEYRKKWVTKKTVMAIKQMIEWSGLEHLIVSHPDPHITQQLGRFGFKVTHPVCVMSIGEDDGLWRRRSHSPTSPGAGGEEEEDSNRPQPRREDGGSRSSSGRDNETYRTEQAAD